MKAAFQAVCGAISKIKMRGIDKSATCHNKMIQTHFTEYDILNMFYIAVPPRVYIPLSNTHSGTQENHGVLPDYTGEPDTISR